MARFAGAEVIAGGGAGATTEGAAAASTPAGPAPANAPAAAAPSATVAAPPAVTPAPVTPAPAAPQPAGPASGTSGSAATSSQVITGQVVSTRYGNVQVAVTFTNGVISSVATLQAPSGRESSQINAYATPILAQEAVAANSATIDTVSGASFTSAAYAKSLQSAIDQRG
ncbi:MAG: FMN-binding protein [Actinobacteria bacterium]|nr:FMN-binding protein [Actinomycetota bacterium]